MKRVKIGLSVLIIIAVVLAVFQNQSFFMKEESLGINFYFSRYDTPLLPNIVMFLVCFFAGLLTSFLSAFSNKLKYGKLIKVLRSREDYLMELVSSLRQELEKNKIVVRDDESTTHHDN